MQKEAKAWIKINKTPWTGCMEIFWWWKGFSRYHFRE